MILSYRNKTRRCNGKEGDRIIVKENVRGMGKPKLALNLVVKRDVNVIIYV